MCGCTCGTPPPPVAAPAAVVPAVGVNLDCGPEHSGIVLTDELGRLMVNINVDVTINGVTASRTTNGSGMIIFDVPPGAAVQIAIPETHEAQPGESTNDPSGRHFRLLGNGP